MNKEQSKLAIDISTIAIDLSIGVPVVSGTKAAIQANNMIASSYLKNNSVSHSLISEEQIRNDEIHLFSKRLYLLRVFIIGITRRKRY